MVRVSEVKEGRMLLTIFIWIDDVENRHSGTTEYRRNLVRVFEESGNGGPPSPQGGLGESAEPILNEKASGSGFEPPTP